MAVTKTNNLRKGMKDDNGATDILELQKALTNSGQGKSDNGAQNTTSPAVQAPSYRYDAAKDPVYQQALQNQQQVQAQAPTYAGTFDQQVKELYDQVMGQKPFAYDLNGDALWQQYKDQYTTQGKMAMMDTMGQAAALTGGYGSSYSQAAGQQAYQGSCSNSMTGYRSCISWHSVNTITIRRR